MLTKVEIREKEWLEEQYIELGKSCREIGEIAKVTTQTVLRRMRYYDIPRVRGRRSMDLVERAIERQNERHANIC